MARTTTTPRSNSLSRDEILRAAVDVADKGGFDALSMRNLADELNTAPMSLYRHVRNKEDLLDGMIDIVFGEMYVPAIKGEWKSELRKRGISAREALLRHRWAIGRMEDRMNPGPASAKHHNATMGCLREAGLVFRDAVHAYSLMDSYTYGFALQEKTSPFETPEESAEMARTTVGEMGSMYPYLAEVVVQFAKDGYNYGEEFEFGLDLILDGLERFSDR